MLFVAGPDTRFDDEKETSMTIGMDLMEVVPPSSRPSSTIERPLEEFVNTTRASSSSTSNHLWSIEASDTETTATTSNKTRIAYAVSITRCQWSVIDAAAVHGYSIDLQHQRDNQNRENPYTHRRYAFVHPSAFNCSDDLRRLGYTVQLKESPINVSAIQSPILREDIEERGCCGSNEFLKLYAYTVPEPICIHLDTDVLILQPLTEIFDMMLGREPSAPVQIEDDDDEQEQQRVHNQTNSLHRNNITFAYTRDYAQGSRITVNTSQWGVQGGFFVVKTDPTKLPEFQQIIQQVNYTEEQGWGKLGFGGYWGAAQVQGFLSYIYGHVYPPDTSVELNRCVYDNMHDPVRFEDGRKKGQCRTLKPTCLHDCQNIPFSQVKVAHLTLCSKPWRCRTYYQGFTLCSEFLQAWFKLRRRLESTEWGQDFEPPTPDMWLYNASMGYCRKVLRPFRFRRKGRMYNQRFGEYTRMKLPE